MSTRSSLKFETDESTGQTIHLYEEAFDAEHVYLELKGFPFEVSSSLELSGQGPGRVAIRLPQEWAKKLGLLNS